MVGGVRSQFLFFLMFFVTSVGFLMSSSLSSSGIVNMDPCPLHVLLYADLSPHFCFRASMVIRCSTWK